LERAGRILIGRKSDKEAVEDFFGIGMTLETFQSLGNTDVSTTKLKR
jgi:hypothetical protein